MFLDQLLFELSSKNANTHNEGHTDSDKYSAVAFCKNVTIVIKSRIIFLVSLLRLTQYSKVNSLKFQLTLDLHVLLVYNYQHGYTGKFD